MTPADLDRTPLRDLVDRFEHLAGRDLISRYAPGTGQPPLSTAEHVELIAVRAAVRQHVGYRQQSVVWRARQSGASWVSIAAASDTDVETARQDFRRWIDGQAALWDATSVGCRPFGLSPAERTEARRLADPPTDRKEVTTTR